MSRTLYYIGCAAREGEMAPGLYGIWITTDNPSWCGDFHMNYNFMAPFYGMYSSNRYEAVTSLTDQMLEHMEQGEWNANNNLSVVKSDYVAGREDLQDGIDNGILYPCGLGPWGSVAIEKYMNQTLDAPFASTMFISYYNYSGDTEFLVNEAYPFLDKIANFYEQWYEKEDLGDGNYRYVLYDGPHEEWWGKNAGVTIGLVQNVYETLINNYDILKAERDDVTEEKLAMWKDMYEHMSDIPVRTYTNGDFSKEVFALTEEGTSVLRPESASVELEFVHPGERLSFGSDPELLEIGRNTVEAKEVANGNIWGQINNTPKIFTQAIRLGYDPQYIMDQFRSSNLSKMEKNFTINDNTHGIEKAGGIEFINNMLLQSSNGIIKVFPNWTGADASYNTLREKGAFLVSSEMKEGAVQYVELTSEKGNEVKLVNPWGDANVIVTDSNGNKVAYTKGSTVNSGENTVEFETEENVTYMITKSDGEDEEVSKTTLEYFLNSAKEHVANGDTEGLVESVQKLFEEAIAEGEAVMADENATKEEVTNATIKLMKAIQALDFKAGDKTDLEMALDLAEMIDLTNYVEEGQAEYLAAKEAAERVMADGDGMQDEVNEAWNALADAMNNLRLKANKDALQDLLDSLEGLDLSLYTEESVQGYTAAFAKAEAVLADETLSADKQDEVDAAVKALAAAKEQLVLKEENQGGSGDGQNPDGNTETSGGDNSGNNGQAQGSGNTDNAGGDNGNSSTAAGNSVNNAAKTGDNMNPAVWAALLGVAAVIAGAVSVKKRKQVK